MKRQIGRNMVGARGFEPPASWSRTTKEKEINNLQVGTPIRHAYPGLCVFNQFQSGMIGA